MKTGTVNLLTEASKLHIYASSQLFKLPNKAYLGIVKKTLNNTNTVHGSVRTSEVTSSRTKYLAHGVEPP